MKTIIVGSGTAALISALILKNYLDMQIDIVYSNEIGIIGVGEGSTEHFSEFMKFCNISNEEIINRCGATYKSGVMFENWGGKKRFLHSVSFPFNKKFAQYSNVYAKLISEDSDILCNKNFLENKISLDNLYENKFNQYHFDTYMLNSFLKEKCIDAGINFYEDIIEDVVINETGNIDHLLGQKQKYNYDFYIDSSGFKKILISKLGGIWESFSESLRMNSALTFKVKNKKEYNLWTLSKAMDSGWMFRIPTQSRYGNGYIYDSSYISDSDIEKELSKEFNQDIEINKTFKFDPGFIKNPWIKNCVAIGLSSSFVEPLEATSIATSIQQSFLLMHKINNYNEKDVTLYNKSFNDICYNIRDFIFLHYCGEKNNTPFWKDVSIINQPEFIKNFLPLWKNRLPIYEDFNDMSNYILFSEDNFLLIMHGLDMFNKDSIKKELHGKNIRIINDAEKTIDDIGNEYKKIQFVSHNDFIKMIQR